MLPLEGGRRKRDVKRGFSIVESGGVVRFFLAESGAEFEQWIRDIDRITRRSGESSDLATEETGRSFIRDQNRMDTDQSGDFSASPSRGVTVDGVHNDNTPRRAQIREKFSSVTSSTKSKLGSAAAGAKTRLGPAAAGTKNKIGSVVQAARHRSMSHSDEGIGHANEDEPVASALQDRSFSSADHVTDASHDDSGANQSRKMGGRFAAVKAGTKNKFGSALQAAKEKGKAAAVQRRRRIQERGDHNNAYDSRSASSDPFSAGVEAQSILAANPTRLRSTVVPLGEQMAASEETNNVMDLSENSQPVLGSGKPRHETVEREGVGFDSSQSIESDEVSSENLTTSSGPARRQQLKSKLGAAVQSVRLGTSQDGSLRRRFGGSAGEDSHDARFLDPSSTLKLRGIHSGHGNPVDELNGDYTDADVQLETVRGLYWVASVAVCKLENEIPAPLETENTVYETTPPIANEISQEVNGGDQLTDTSSTADPDRDEEGEAHEEPKLSDRQRRLENAYKIHVFSGEDEISRSGENEGDVSEVVRSLSDLLALQTALSDCVSRVILVATCSTGKRSTENEAGEEEGSPDSLSDKDMNSLDSVRFAGRLLRGLVETGSDEFENEKEYNDYQCEF